MNPNGLRARMRRGEPLCGVFVKTPEVQIVEVLAQAGFDFLCFDAEHSPFDRGRLDACLAMARALGQDFLNKYVLPFTQLRRLIRPEEIADAICFMISNSAVSGELWADAGWHPPA